MIGTLIFLAIAIGLIALLIGFFLGSQFVPDRVWFAGIVLLAIPQIYLLPVAGVYPSIAFLASIGALYSFKYLPELFKLHWVKAFIALFFMQLVSIAWSQSPLTGVRHLIYLLPFLIAAFVGFGYARYNDQKAQRYIYYALWLSVIEALLVIVFRVVPIVESAFIGSRLAGIVISPNVLGALFDGSPNNIFDPGKAGGLFVNANTASAMLGFCCMLAWNMGKVPGMGSLRVVAALNWLAVFFTGSKAGAIMAVAIPSLLLALELARSRRIDMRLAATLAFVGAAVVVAIPFAVEYMLDSNFLTATSSTLDIRRVIWNFASQEFFKSPLKGMGFGGWEARFPFYAYINRVSPTYPAHNAFMILWGQSGLLAVVLLGAFIGFFLHWVFKASQHIDAGVQTLGKGLFMGVLWFWIQAQGENFGILGEQHFTPLLGLLSGVLLARMQTFAKSHANSNSVEKKF